MIIFEIRKIIKIIEYIRNFIIKVQNIGKYISSRISYRESEYFE